MSPRASIPLGLVAGVVVAALVLGGIVALAPEPSAAATPPPRPSMSFAVPSASPSVDPGGSASPDASGGPAASGDPGGSPSASTGALPAGSGGPFNVGEAAPVLVVPQVGGGTIDLAALRGKPVWVNFMGTYCPPCVDEFPLMNGFAARHADDGLVVLAIDVKEDEGTVAAFARELAATFPLGLDRDGSAQARWDAIALPIHFWVDRDGVIRDGALGGIGPDIMARGLRSILPGVVVRP